MAFDFRCSFNGTSQTYDKTSFKRRNGYVLYTSIDAINWDDCTYIANKKGLCYYSNDLNLTENNGDNFLLLQYSEVYNDSDVDVAAMAKEIFEGKNVQRLENSRVNVMHRILRIKR